MKTFTKTKILAMAACTSLATAATADQVITDDLIVQGSICAGLDCNNGESFGFTTIRMKENNTRLQFMDTSNSASFPTNDWTIQANDSTNGGANYLAFLDDNTSRIPFRVEAAAPSNALVVEADGDIGIKTLNPVVDIHVVEGNTPTLRLEQDGSDGFTPQTWDVAGNEANFFIRDVTNGSNLPFRIQPGSGTDDALYIASDGDIGMGTSSPESRLHVRNVNGALFDSALVVQDAGGTTTARVMAQFENNGTTIIQMNDTSNGTELAWNLQVRDDTENNDFRIVNASGTGEEFSLTTDGNLTITGELTTAGSCNVGCDRVFDADYEILPIAERAEIMFSNGYLPNVGPTAEDGPFNITDKMGRMLNELEHAHIYIADLNARVIELEGMLLEMQAQ